MRWCTDSTSLTIEFVGFGCGVTFFGLDAVIPGLLGRPGDPASPEHRGRSGGDWEDCDHAARASGGLPRSRESRLHGAPRGVPGMTLCVARRGAGWSFQHNVKPDTSRWGALFACPRFASDLCVHQDAGWVPGSLFVRRKGTWYPLSIVLPATRSSRPRDTRLRRRVPRIGPGRPPVQPHPSRP